MNDIAELSLATDRMIARRDGPVGWLIFNNPARHNAVSMDMWRAVAEAMARFAADDKVRVAVLAGAGGKAFASGADISEFEKHRATAAAEEEYHRISAEAQAALADFPKPLLAMIRGYCIGGGLAIAMQADIRVAAEGSRFGIPAARLGLAYGLGATQALIDLVGPAMAKEILFTARRLDGEEALRAGLINRLVPGDALESTVDELARAIAGNAPLTIRAAKFGVAQALKDPGDRDIATLDAMMKRCFDSEDYAEGRRAFMEKRAPAFKGR